MNDYRQCAADLIDWLHLTMPPIAIALRDAVPGGIPSFEGVLPAGCAFWGEAAKRTFATSTKNHELCAVGVYTHHLSEPSASFQAELGEVLKAMSGLDYVRPDEIAAIPVVKHEVKHVLYGPLSAFPLDPDVVLVFADARQSLVITEAVARVDKGVPPAMGRPACALIPQVVNGSAAAMSLGCCGARAYLDALTESTALWAFPGNRLDDYCKQIGVLARANQTLSTFHARRREDVESGKRPTVSQSLERLSS
ncbi:MAG TPA: DUF169 domain-containing protein [Candidatus Binatia bacterium]